MADRFAFGRNWQDYAAHLPLSASAEAESSLTEMLGLAALAGKRFLDIGSGSGLFSLGAIRLNAAAVFSFDYDLDSVACTQSVKDRFAAATGHWTVERGDVLNDSYVGKLGTWDVVYSWGVLHHTGDMWRAVSNAAALVAHGGRFYIALYNDQGWLSRFWHAIKKFYVRAPHWIQRIMNVFFFMGFAGLLTVLDLARLRNPLVRHNGTARRGMTLYTDVVDWIGGYPFQVARVADVIAFMRARGFSLDKVIDVGFRQGCNEFVFIRDNA